jgi:enamine deaminase RidA (YjgF/YER057c/UK114 family)
MSAIIPGWRRCRGPEAEFAGGFAALTSNRVSGQRLYLCRRVLPVAPTLSPEVRLAEAGLRLPDPLPAFGQYLPAVHHGEQLWVGGHFGTHPDGSISVGRCGEGVSVAEARDAARSAALNLLATVRHALGSLEPVVRVTQVLGVVNATPDFTEHTAVIDAASDVFVEAFGDAGRHTRLAVGVSSLPGNLVLEIQAHLIVGTHPASERS